jgi:signal peptidase
VWATLTLAVLCVLATGAVLWREGYRVYVIHTGSMTPTYRPGDIVVDRPAQKQYRPGEVITFLHSGTSSDLVTHRITDITPAGLIHTKGDANASADVWDIRPDQVKGSTMFGVRDLGYLVVFLQQPAGVAAVATSTVGLILLWSLCFPADSTPLARRRGSHRAIGAPVKTGPRHELTPV